MSVSLSYLHNYQSQPYVDHDIIKNEDTLSRKENQTLTSSATVVTLSEQSRQLAETNQRASSISLDNDEAVENTTDDKKASDDSQESIKQTEDEIDGNAGVELTEEESKEVETLKARDLEVKVHEQAHASVGGSHAGSPSYTYEQGPDGKRYAVEGEVPIDVSVIPNDPEATINKMKQVYQAALAPAEPSSADRKIAADAQTKISAARVELSTSQNETVDNPIPNLSSSTTDSTKKDDSNNEKIRNDSKLASYLQNQNSIGGTLSQLV
jgi:hypothetical protein